jgi:hypothetical protein
MPVIDSYSESNRDSAYDLVLSAGFFGAVGQSFTANGSAAASCKFFLAKVGSPTGNIVAKIYAHSGTFGTSSIPTGAALATSNAVAASVLTTSFALVEFTFSSPPTLTNGTKYVVVVEEAVGSTSSHYIRVGSDASSPTHDGNAAGYNGSTWVSGTEDIVFYVESSNASGSAAAWYSSSWLYRVKITVDHTKVDADLTDFPVFVNLANLPAGFHANVNQTDARDIRVTSSDGTTELPRDVVFYNSSSDTGELHFKASSLANSANTEFFIYYGNASASEPAANSTYGKNNVYTNGYRGVWHMGTPSTVSGADSTSYAHNGTVTGTTAMSGKVGGAMDFDGVDDVVVVGSSANLDITGSLTVSGWLNIPDTSGFDVIMDHAREGMSVENYCILHANGTLYFQWHNGSFRSVTASNFFSGLTNSHVFIVITYDSGTVTIYRNGASVASASGQAALVTDSNNVFKIGRYQVGSQGYTDGIIDEVRVAASVRSSGWVSTEYNNQNSPSTFYTVGSQEIETATTLIFPRHNIQALLAQ